MKYTCEFHNHQSNSERCAACAEGEERLTPGGEHLLLVGELAKRGSRHGATTSQGQSLRVIQTKGGVMLGELEKMYRHEAASWEFLVKQGEQLGANQIVSNAKKRASYFNLLASHLTAALDAEPQPQREAEVVEECPDCGHTIMNGPCWERCPDSDCGAIRSKGHGGDDVSGACLSNAHVIHPVTPEKSDV